MSSFRMMHDKRPLMLNKANLKDLNERNMENCDMIAVSRSCSVIAVISMRFIYNLDMLRAMFTKIVLVFYFPTASHVIVSWKKKK